MIHLNATLLHDFFQVTIRDAISDIEKYSDRMTSLGK
jgi:hypothetical protein